MQNIPKVKLPKTVQVRDVVTFDGDQVTIDRTAKGV